MIIIYIVLLAFTVFLLGFFSGIFLIGILRSGKTVDMWIAIEQAAYKGDNSFCKSLLEMKVDNE